MINHLRALAVFAKTVEHGSFRAAADDLELSPSVVSHHISQLEEQLGVALLYRSTRTLSLTRDGERLIGAAQAMLSAAEDGINTVLDHASGLSGELQITAPAVLAQSPLADKITQFLRVHPGVKISIDFSDDRRDVVADGIDVAIRMGWLRDSALKARKLYDVERVLVASNSLLTGRPVPKSPKDLEDWDWLDLASVPLKPIFRHASQKTITLRPATRLTANSAAALYQFVARGAGIAALPRFLAEADIQAGTTQVLLPEWRISSIAVYAVRPQNATRDGLTATFVNSLAK
ncbi:MAG: LysR family transcriptional regulator [Hyphomicrobiaceae bacterium]